MLQRHACLYHNNSLLKKTSSIEFIYIDFQNLISLLLDKSYSIRE